MHNMRAYGSNLLYLSWATLGLRHLKKPRESRAQYRVGEAKLIHFAHGVYFNLVGKGCIERVRR